VKAPKTVIAIGGVLFASAFFVATRPITPELALISSLAVIIFALPSYLAAMKCLGKKKGLLLLGALGIYALIIESLAIHTGFPYGNFTYTDILGNKLFGLTPWTVAFAYPPILLLAYYFSRSIITFRAIASKSIIKLLVLTAIIATAIDVVLDPAAVRLGFWYWDSPGSFYGVPLINFVGWLLTAFLGAVLLHSLWGQKVKPPPSLAYSGLAILWFWTSINIWLLQWIPAILGGAFSIILIRLISAKQGTINR
jgi:bisanhydrobacterioruberin hydratase